MIEPELYWICPECYYLVSDLEKRSIMFPNLPCPRCSRSMESYVPVVKND